MTLDDDLKDALAAAIEMQLRQGKPGTLPADEIAQQAKKIAGDISAKQALDIYRSAQAVAQARMEKRREQEKSSEGLADELRELISRSGVK